LIFFNGGGLIFGGALIFLAYRFLEPCWGPDAGLGDKYPTGVVTFGEPMFFETLLDSTALPLFEQDKQTLIIDFSIITFLLTSVCFPHNSQKEAMYVLVGSNLLGFGVCESSSACLACLAVCFSLLFVSRYIN
jgi:hypothetical protein